MYKKMQKEENPSQKDQNNEEEGRGAQMHACVCVPVCGITRKKAAEAGAEAVIIIRMRPVKNLQLQ
jgi:hypothetical protein